MDYCDPLPALHRTRLRANPLQPSSNSTWHLCRQNLRIQTRSDRFYVMHWAKALISRNRERKNHVLAVPRKPLARMMRRRNVLILDFEAFRIGSLSLQPPHRIETFGCGMISIPSHDNMG